MASHRARRGIACVCVMWGKVAVVVPPVFMARTIQMVGGAHNRVVGEGRCVGKVFGAHGKGVMGVG